MTELTQHKSRTARTFYELRDAILSAHYPPGKRLFIDQISKDMGVSSGAIREALSRLTAEELVIAAPQRGFIVAPISKQELQDLTDVRVTIEALCIKDSLERGDLNWEGKLLSVHHRMSALGDAYNAPGSPEAKQWHQLHKEFHDQITAGCRNQWWLKLRSQLFIQSERYRRLSGTADEEERDIAEEHNQLFRAALDRDIEAALDLMEKHLRKTTKILLKSSLPFADPQV